MRSILEKLFRQYGTDLTIKGEAGEKTLRGFFQAVNTRSWQSIESTASPLGEISRGQYTYIGPVSGGVREGDTLVLGDRSYRFRRVERYYYRSSPIYEWGICVEKGVNDTWGSQS